MCKFLGARAPNGILPAAKFTLHPSLAFSYIGSVTARQSSSGHSLQCGTRIGIMERLQRVAPIFGRVAITGIGPHSSFQSHNVMFTITVSQL